MKRLLILALLLCSTSVWATIAQHSGANQVAASATTNSVTYSPTTGNTVIVFLNTTSTINTVSCKDNNNNTLTAGSTGAGGTDDIFPFYGTAITGATSYSCSWTNSSASTISVEDYSGVVAVNTGLANNTGTATSASASLTVTTEDNNDWNVCGFGDAGNTFTVTVGNSRQNQSTSTPKGVIM